MDTRSQLSFCTFFPRPKLRDHRGTRSIRWYGVLQRPFLLNGDFAIVGNVVQKGETVVVVSTNSLLILIVNEFVFRGEPYSTFLLSNSYIPTYLAYILW